MINRENKEEVSFKDSIGKDSLDMLNMRNSPGDAMWGSVLNMFTRRKPIRFFDVFVGFFLVIFVLLVLTALAFSFVE